MQTKIEKYKKMKEQRAKARCQKGGMYLQQMNFETFIHRVAMEFGNYLPKEYAGYETVVKCKRQEGDQTARLTLEKSNVEFVRSIELYPYFLNYKKGIHLELLMREMAGDLVHPTGKKKVKKEKKIPLIYRNICLAVSGIIGLAILMEMVARKRRENF